MNGELADLVVDFWDSPLVIEAARAVLEAPQPEPAVWVKLLEGLVV